MEHSRNTFSVVHTREPRNRDRSFRPDLNPVAQRAAIHAHRVMLHQRFIENHEKASRYTNDDDAEIAFRSLVLTAANRDIGLQRRYVSSLLSERPTKQQNLIDEHCATIRAGWFSLLLQVDQFLAFESPAVRRRFCTMNAFTGELSTTSQCPDKKKILAAALENISCMGVWFASTDMPLSVAVGCRSLGDLMPSTHRLSLDAFVEKSRGLSATPPVFDYSTFIGDARTETLLGVLDRLSDLRHQLGERTLFLVDSEMQSRKWSCISEEDENDDDELWRTSSHEFIVPCTPRKRFLTSHPTSSYRAFLAMCSFVLSKRRTSVVHSVQSLMRLLKRTARRRRSHNFFWQHSKRVASLGHLQREFSNRIVCP